MPIYEPKPLGTGTFIEKRRSLKFLASIQLAEQLLSLIPDSPPLPLVVRLMFCLKPSDDDWDHPDFLNLYADLGGDDESFDLENSGLIPEKETEAVPGGTTYLVPKPGIFVVPCMALWPERHVECSLRMAFTACLIHKKPHALRRLLTFLITSSSSSSFAPAMDNRNHRNSEHTSKNCQHSTHFPSPSLGAQLSVSGCQISQRRSHWPSASWCRHEFQDRIR